MHLIDVSRDLHTGSLPVAIVRRHVRGFVLKLLVLMLLALTVSMFAWLPASRALLKVELHRAVTLEQTHFLTEGSLATEEKLRAAGFPGVPGVVVDSIAVGTGHWYLRLRHRFSPARCWYEAARFEGALQCR